MICTDSVGPLAHGRVSGIRDGSGAGSEQLAAGVLREIVRRTGYRIDGLSVTPQDGCLLVQGRVRTYYVKQLVLAAVLKALEGTGVKVSFELEVTSNARAT